MKHTFQISSGPTSPGRLTSEQFASERLTSGQHSSSCLRQLVDEALAPTELLTEHTVVIVPRWVDQLELVRVLPNAD